MSTLTGTHEGEQNLRPAARPDMSTDNCKVSAGIAISEAFRVDRGRPVLDSPHSDMTLVRRGERVNVPRANKAVTAPRLRGRSTQKDSGPRDYALRKPHEVVPITASDANARESRDPIPITPGVVASIGRLVGLAKAYRRKPRRNDQRLTGKPLLASRACRFASRVLNYALILVATGPLSSLFRGMRGNHAMPIESDPAAPTRTGLQDADWLT
jgi:hypothetical protein